MKNEQYRLRGLYFEEFEVGYEVKSPGRTVTEADVVMFASLSGDWNQLHTDSEYAKETLFGERVAHGLLGLTIASGLGARTGFIEGTAEALLGLDWKFRAPIKIGDTVHLVVKVAQKKEMPKLGGGIVIFNASLLNQNGETVQEGRWRVLVKGKDERQLTD
jgi:acyl dehydratase